MKKCILLAGAALVMACAQAQEPVIRDAIVAAERWLAVVDKGESAASWEQLASAAQAVVTRAGWQDALRKVREPLGKPSRQMESAVFTRTFPGAPPGEYIVIQYNTRFDKLPDGAMAIETIAPMRDKDGTWRVSGYYIKTADNPQPHARP
jgi:uncharacterized lipoprotein NlpE involved in copper resistance